MDRQQAKEIAVRAGKTFIQAFLGSITIDAATISGGVSVWRSVLVSGLAAGLSAVMNLIIATLSTDDK